RAQAAAQLRRAECHWVLANTAQALELFGSALELARLADWDEGQDLALRRIRAAYQEGGGMRPACDHRSQARRLTRARQRVWSPPGATQVRSVTSATSATWG
ncbi:hypothetical protein, partial [Streptomyces narbonensis]